MKNIIKVVGAIFRNEKGEIFTAKRPMDKKFGGLWEFPGGKIEKGETLEDAIIREIKEELNLEIKVNSIFTNIQKEYDEFVIDLTCLECEILDVTKLELKEHIEYMWISREKIKSLDWVPTDYPILDLF